MLEEALHVRLDLVHVPLAVDALALLHPLADLDCRVAVPLVEEEDGAEVVHVADDAPNGLVDGARGLQTVPFLAIDLKVRLLFIFLVKILLLLHDSRVIDTGIRNAKHENCSRCVVNKIDAFGELATTDAIQDGPLSLVDALAVSLEHLLEVLAVSRLGKDLAVESQLRLVPLGGDVVHQIIARKEDEYAAWNVTLHLLNEVAHAHRLLI